MRKSSSVKAFDMKSVYIMILVLWIVFSVSYVVLDVWEEFKINKMEAAYNQGKADAVRTVIRETAKCSAVPLYDGDKKVEIFSLECLKKAQQKQADQSTQEEK